MRPFGIIILLTAFNSLVVIDFAVVADTLTKRTRSKWSVHSATQPNNAGITNN